MTCARPENTCVHRVALEAACRRIDSEIKCPDRKRAGVRQTYPVVADPNCNTVPSPKRLPTTCIPTGLPSTVTPTGTLIAG